MSGVLVYTLHLVLFLIFIFSGVCFVCVYVLCMCECNTSGGQKRVMDPLKLNLVVVVSCPV